MAMFRAYTETRRVFAVIRVIIDLIIDVFLSRLYTQKGLTRRTLGKRFVAGLLRRVFRREKGRVKFAVQFRRALERLGPTYVKLGQILSLRDDLLPERITDELRKLQNQAPPVPYQAIKKVIEDDFNLPLHLIFKEFDKEPIAAASLAQVHMAILKNGKRVVVKVQRPGIMRLITDDINIMRRLASTMERIPGLRDYRPVNFVEEFADYTMRELDFTQEGKHSDQFRENFSDDPHIIFPKIFWDYTSRKVLTMQHIDGVKPDDGEKLKRLGIDTRKIARIGANTVIKMLFVDGFFHGDPHPGNMLIVGRSKICLLDLGMVGSFSEEVRRNMFLYYYYLARKEYDVAVKYIANLTTQGPRANPEGFKKEMAEAVGRWSGAGFHGYSMGKLIFETMNIGARNQIYFHSDLVLSSKALITVESVAHRLDPELEVEEASKTLLENIFSTHFSPLRVGKSVLNSLPDYMDFFERLPQNLLKTMNMVTSGKLQVQLAEPRVKEKPRRAGLYPILTGATILAGAMFAISENTPGPIIETFMGMNGVPMLSLLMFGLTGVFLYKSLPRSKK